MKVFAHDTDWRSTDPHAIVLDLSDEDVAHWNTVRERERPGRYEVGTFVAVTDRTTGKVFEVATAPCGAGCRCAAVARGGAA